MSLIIAIVVKGSEYAGICEKFFWSGKANLKFDNLLNSSCSREMLAFADTKTN